MGHPWKSHWMWEDGLNGDDDSDDVIYTHTYIYRNMKYIYIYRNMKIHICMYLYLNPFTGYRF